MSNDELIESQELQIRKTDDLDLIRAQVSTALWMRVLQQIEDLQSRVLELERILERQEEYQREQNESKS